MKIRSKIFIFTTTFILVFSLSIGLFTINRIHKNILQEEIHSATIENQAMATSLKYLFLDEFQNSRAMVINSQTKEELISNIERFLIKSSYNSKRYVLFNKDGEIESSSSGKFNISAESLDAALTGTDNYTLINIDNEYLLFVYSKFLIEGEANILCSKTNLTKIINSSEQSYNTFLYSFIVFLIIISVFTFIFTKYITKDIQKLNDRSKEVILGNYSSTLNITSNDEIGELAASFDLMTKEINEKVNGLNNEVSKTQKLFDNLTHEIKTPLTSIIGYADLLRKSEYDENLYDMGLMHIYKEGKRLSKLSTKLIQIVDLGSTDLDEKYLDVFELINDCISVNEYKTYDKKIRFNIIGDKFNILGDKDLLTNVIINIIDNAIKASKVSDIINIRTSIQLDIFKIIIEDNGIGMSKELQNHIFEAFYKADKSRNNKDSLGLGLSIAKDIMTLHGGYIEIESEIGIGTKVSLIFTTPLQMVDKL